MLGDDDDFYDDVNMGPILNNSYWSAALSAIAVNSTRITDLLLTSSCNTAGIFGAEIYIRGLPTTINIDDYYALYDGDTFYFENGGDDDSMWSIFMEKVYAKASGNY